MADDYTNNTSTSGVVTAGGQPVFGTIETVDDNDWFKITLNANQTYQFSMLLTTPLEFSLPDPYLELRDASGEVIRFDYNGGGDGSSLIVFKPTTSGTYYLSAWDYGYGLGTYALVADDHLDDTSGAGRITVGTPVSGGIELGNDIDWYAVTLAAGTQYTIDLKGSPSGNGTLADPFFNGIYDAAGNYLEGTVNDDFGSSAESRVVFTPSAQGTYYLAAAGYDSSDTGTYKLSISGVVVPDIAATTATTATLTVGNTLRSTIGTGSDVDWVKVTLTAGQTYVVELNADDNTFNPLADPNFIGIYNSVGALIPGTGNDDYGIGLNSRVTFTPSANGTYYLAAGAYGGETGAYALSLLSAASATDTIGTTTTTAAALSVGVTGTLSAVNFARDVDWFKVTLNGGQNYVIDARGVASGVGTLADPQIVAIYNSAGNIVAGTGNDDANGTLDAQDFFRPTSNGSYYVAVGAADDGTGTYKVSVQTAPATNDIPDDATTSATFTNGMLSSTIGTPGDVDWVRVDLTAGSTYTVQQLGSASSDGTLADPQIIGVYNGQGQALPNSTDDDSGTGSNAQVTITAPTSGTYYVAAGSFGDETGSYKLKISGATADTTAPTLRSTSPADNDASVPVASNLTLEFSEAVKAGSGNITISGGGQTKVISVTDASQVSFSGDTMTLNPSTSLLAGTDYTVTFGAGVVKDLAGNNFAGITSSTQFNFKTAAGASTESWTVMVYMAADNNLEQFAIGDLNEMESVVLPGSVNVVTLVDRAPGYDTSNGNWTDTRSGVINHDSSLTTVSSPLTSLGELNTGSGQTLTNFINSSVASRPADNYALIIWDHGGGLSGTAWDDSSNGDNLTVREMQEAVDASVVGKFDFIGFDACLQGLLEQAWELRGLADVVVASQELEPGDGWEYQDFLGQLAANPTMTAFDLADAVVDAYATRYAGEADTTLSATRTGALADLRAKLDVFADAAISAGSGVIAGLKNAVARTTEFDAANNHDYRDLGDFLREVGTAVSDSNVKAAAASALSAVQAAVLTHTGTVAGANGLSVYLPVDGMADSYLTQDFEFLQSTGWGNFLRFLTNDQRADNLLGDELNNDIRGFAGNDTLSGGTGNDRLDGGAGNDSMTGGAGNDSYYVQSSGDRVVEASGGGTDTVYSALSGYTLGANVENGRINTAAASNLSGNTLNNVLTAGAGSNVLNGDSGIDTADYGTATAAVTVSLATNSTQATGGSGSDTLLLIESLTGSAYNDRLTGDAGNNVLSGGSGNDTLSGDDGNDVLDGGSGNDSMTGGAGNDSYVVGASGDRVVEASSGGTDSVSSSITHTLAVNVENLTLSGTSAISGTGNTSSNGITGNTAANSLSGGDGNDSLNGADGNDTLSGGNGNDLLDGGNGNDSMTGGAGNDRYVVQATGDRVVEIGGGGTDSVSSGITYTLAAEVENLTLTGASAITGTGNTLSNAITGNTGANSLSGADGNDSLSGGDGNDTLSGGNGNDRLEGGIGNDSLSGGAGIDTFRFASALNGSTNVDRLADFNVVDDRIELENSIFTKFVTPGALQSSFFHASTAGTAVDINDFVLYDTDSGQLYYDADGSGGGARVLIATLTGMPALTSADIFVT